MRQTLMVLSLVFAAAACGNLDAIDYVHDLRMLAVRATPPEQLVDPNVVIAGVGAGATSTAPVQLDALVADPAGAGRPIRYTFCTCAALDTNSSSCLTTSPGYQVFATGQATTSNGWGVVSTTFTPTDAQIALTFTNDPYHAVDGLRLPVQLTITAGTDTMTGVKLVVYTPPYPGITFAPHNNPNLTGMTVESATWPNPGVFTFSTSAEPKDGWSIAPVFDANAQATYQVPAFDGQVLTFTESWLFDYFSTFGDYFSPTTAGGYQVATNVANPASSLWKPAPVTTATSGNFYFVVRDGRGGENWLVLNAELTP